MTLPVSRCALWALLLVSAAFLPARSAPAQPLKIIVVMTDDQRWDTLWAMPSVQDRLVGRGVLFENAFVTTSTCCPMRASLLSGGYLAQNTGVLTNTLPNGGFARFDETNSLAVRLQRAGWKTALLGKYLNGYPWADPPYIPRGWDLFFHSRLDQEAFLHGSTGPNAPGTGVLGELTQFRTYEYRDRVIGFLDAHAADPVFVLLSTNLPHEPAPSAPGDEGLFESFVHRGRAWCEADVSDKPNQAWPCNEQTIQQKDELHRNQLRSLQAVDRVVRDLYDHVEARGWLSHTVFVFTSDNGLLWGEHRLYGKSLPYEEALRVPLVVVHPEAAPRSEPAPVLVNLDLPATVAELAGLPASGDGAGLMPLLRLAPGTPWRDRTFFEDWSSRCPWTALRTATHKWIERCDGAHELYDLVADPFEERNVADDPLQASLRAQLAADLQSRKGLAITYQPPQAPVGIVGQSYEFEISVWGAQGPVKWSVAGGELPPGLRFKGGAIKGTPRQAGIYNASVRAEDSARATYTGQRRSHTRDLLFIVMDP